MKARLVGGSAIIAFLAMIVYLDLHLVAGVPTLAIVALLTLMAAFELVLLLRKRAIPCDLWGLLAAVVLLLWMRADPWLDPTSFFGAVSGHLSIGRLALGLLFYVLVKSVLLQNVERGFDEAVWTTGGFLFVPVTLSMLIDIRALLPVDQGLHLLLFLVVVSKIGDTCGYFVGRAIGRHRAIPLVSPGKTWEGCVASACGALVAACALGLGAGWLPPEVGLSSALLAGIIINLAAQFGDLSASLLKRRLQVKDSSDILPEFGGVIDLVDSFLLAAPVFALYVRIAIP